MSMLVPPQMINTMVPGLSSADPGFTDAFYADPVRRYMIPVFSDRRTDWPSHPQASRDSLHEAEMWAVEGLTHRYPTKVLAELLPTCPQYCGHCTRMDLVGNPTPVVEKHKFGLSREDRLGAMIDYLRGSPGVRDVVVSGGDVANLPWPRLESFVAGLLEIDNIRDIRLATKALMGLPQYWLTDEVRAGMERLATVAPPARRQHRHPHARELGPVGHAAGGRGRQGDAGDRHPRRPQPGRAAARHQRQDRAAARPVLRPARRREDHAVLLLHVRHDPQHRALAAVAGRGAAAAARHHGLPARLRHAAVHLRRAVRGQALGAPGRHGTTASSASRTGPRTTGPASRPTTRWRSSGSTSTTTRSTCCRRLARSTGGRRCATPLPLAVG